MSSVWIFNPDQTYQDYYERVTAEQKKYLGVASYKIYTEEQFEIRKRAQIHHDNDTFTVDNMTPEEQALFDSHEVRFNKLAQIDGDSAMKYIEDLPIFTQFVLVKRFFKGANIHGYKTDIFTTSPVLRRWLIDNTYLTL